MLASVNGDHFKTIAVVRGIAAVVLLFAAFTKVITFGATVRYLGISIPVGLPQVALQAMGGLLIALEVAMAVLLIVRPTPLVFTCAGWLFLAFAGWHLAGLVFGAPSCPCLGAVTAAMNAATNQIVMTIGCATGGSVLVVTSSFSQRSGS